MGHQCVSAHIVHCVWHIPVRVPPTSLRNSAIHICTRTCRTLLTHPTNQQISTGHITRTSTLHNSNEATTRLPSGRRLGSLLQMEAIYCRYAQNNASIADNRSL